MVKVDESEIDLGGKWPRIEMTQIMKEKLDMDVEKETVESLLSYAKKNCPDMQVVGGETKTFINKNNGWVEDASWNAPFAFVTDGRDDQVRLADINGDGTVNIFDMVLLGRNWG